MSRSQRLFLARRAYLKAFHAKKKYSGLWKVFRDARTACLIRSA